MIAYAVIMFAAAALFLGVGISIHRGNTKLINDYHQKKIREEDLPAYGRDFARGMFVICAGMAASGILDLLGDSRTIMKLAIGTLFAGLAAGIAIIIRVQKRYNGGLF